ncbi:MAG: M14 family zinc carboxypeptidase [Bacteroidales bacterium]
MITKNLPIPVLWIVLIAFLNGNSIAQERTENYFKFCVDNHSELETVTRLISIDKVVNDTVYAFATDKQLEEFNNNTDYQYTLTSPYDLKKSSLEMATDIAEMEAWDKYPAYDVYLQMMEKFENDNPGICRIESAGETVEGRELLVAKISDNVDEEEGEPGFFYTSTMHGDEITGFVFMLRLIDSLVSDYHTNPQIKHLVDNIEIYINPNANPDGTYAGGNHTVSEATRGNANYKNLNRDFPDPVDGENKPYEPETQAMMDYAEQQDFALSANFHGGAEVVNYPWDGVSRAHPDEEWFKYISLIYANSAKENSPEGYFEGIDTSGVTNGYNWYPIYGGRQDYMTYFRHGREVTIEISETKLLPSDLLPDYWGYNKEALFLFMEQALCGIKGKVRTDSGAGLNAKVEILNHDTEIDQSWVYSDEETGSYNRLIESGNYDMAFHADGYQSDTVRDVIVPENNFVNVDVTLEQGMLLEASKDSIYKELSYGTNELEEILLHWYGENDFEYEIDMSGQEDWISVEPTEGVIENATGTDTLFVNLDASELDAGVYRSEVKVSNQDSV